MDDPAPEPEPEPLPEESAEPPLPSLEPLDDEPVPGLPEGLELLESPLPGTTVPFPPLPGGIIGAPPTSDFKVKLLNPTGASVVSTVAQNRSVPHTAILAEVAEVTTIPPRSYQFERFAADAL